MKENRVGPHYRAPGVKNQEASSRRLTGSRLHDKIYTGSESSTDNDPERVPSIAEILDRPEFDNLITRLPKQ